MIDFTKPVQTKDGCPVKIFTAEARDTMYPVKGEVFAEDKWSDQSWTLGGLYVASEEGDSDLINVPEEIEGWLNIYPRNGVIRNLYYDTKIQADIAADPTRIACIKIKFKVGEGL